MSWLLSTHTQYRTSARVGRGWLHMLSIICVAQMTGLPTMFARDIIIFCASTTRSCR